MKPSRTLLVGIYVISCVTLSAAELPIVPCEWSRLNINGGGAIRVLALDKSHPDTVYCGCDVAGVHRSDDAGKTWTMCNTGLRNDADYAVTGLLVDDRNPGRVYMASGHGDWIHIAWQKRPLGGAVFRSDDKGGHWRLLTRDVSFSGEGDGKHSGNVLEFDPVDHNVIYAAGYVQGLWVTRNAGTTWTRLGFEGKSLTGVWVDPDDGKRLLVGVRPDRYQKNNDPGGLFESLNAGKTWKKILDVTVAHDLARHPVKHDWIAATTGDEVHLSQDRGKTWRKLTLNEKCRSTYRVRWHPGQPQRLWTVGSTNGIFFSDDLGKTWVWPTQDPKKTFRYPAVEEAYIADRPHQEWTALSGLSDLLIDPVRPNRMYVCCEYSVNTSTDGGVSWEFSPRGLNLLCVHDITPDPVDPNTIYVLNADHGLLKSTDGGRHFRWPIAEGEFSVNETARLWINPGNNQHLILALTYDWKRPNFWTRVGVSRDGGVTWKSLGKGLPLDDGARSWLTGLAVLDKAGRELMVAYNGEGKSRPGVYATKDGGESWVRDSDGLPEGTLFGSPWTSQPNLVAVDDVIYAGTNDKGIFRRLQREKTWIQIGRDVVPSSFKTLAVCPRRPNSVWVGTQNGLFVSHDRGKTFQRVGPEKMLQCYYVAVDPFNPDRWFVAVPDLWWAPAGQNEPGIYVTADNGKSFSRLTDMPCVGKAWRVVCDPHRKNVIYVGCNGPGSWRGEVKSK